MITELTDKLIQDTFAETGFDQKYFPRYEAEAKHHYEELQKDCPDEEDCTDEDNARASLRITNEYIAYYITEIEKGHSPQWSHEYAYYKVLEEDDDSAVSIAIGSIQEDEKEKELKIHAKSIDNDPIFVNRYVFLFNLGEPIIIERAKDYCQAYHDCISNGKSDIYAHAYGDAVNLDYHKEFCEIYADAYEYAIKHGMGDGNAYRFGDLCTDAADYGYWMMISSFKDQYKEEWQREYYLQLLKQDYEEDKKRPMTDKEFEELREVVMG